MPNAAEIIERTVNAFQRIQAHMRNAKKENATETYEGLKKRLQILKSCFNFFGRKSDGY